MPDTLLYAVRFPLHQCIVFLCEKCHLQYCNFKANVISTYVWLDNITQGLFCTTILTINYLSLCHSLENMRLWIHLHGCNYFAPSSLEISHYYIPQHKSRFSPRTISATKFNTHFTLVCSFKKKQRMHFFLVSLWISGVVKSDQHAFTLLLSHEILNIGPNVLLCSFPDLTVAWIMELSHMREFTCRGLLPQCEHIT